MFIYTKDNVTWFDENDDEIEDYLSDWVHDNIGGDESSFSYFAKGVAASANSRKSLCGHMLSSSS